MSAVPAMREVDPRIAQSRRVILRAALEELGEVGYGSFTIESVAARAGVGKSTIYRHWREKLALISDAFETLHAEAAVDVESGTAREKLARILRHVAGVVAGSTFSRCMPALIDAAERDPQLRRFHLRFQRDARQPLVKIIAEGVATGAFPARVDPSLAAFSLLGAIFFCRLMTSKPLDPDRAAELIDNVLGPSP